MRRIVLMLCLVLFAFMAQAQRTDIMERGRAAVKAGGTELDNFKKKLVKLSKSSKESDLLDAIYGYYGLGDNKTADAIAATVKKKFPKGRMARTNAMFAMTEVKGAEAMEKAYKNWLKTFPPKKFGDDAIAGQSVYMLANAFAREGNVEKTAAYVSQCKDPQWRGMACSSVAPYLVKAGKSDVAGRLLKEGCEVVDKGLSTLDGREKTLASRVFTAYAGWLADNGQPEEAWKLFSTKVDKRERPLSYYKLALDHGKTMETWTILDGLLRQGYADKESVDVMRTAWTKIDGNADGFDDYIKSINKDRIDDMIAKIPEKMIDKPAPDFTLKDIDGNTVQLSKLRGKVVVLDFWATWCGPCKRSLPAMKMTVDKYKNDPDVVFLFIHTWERGTAEQANKDAKAYLHDHGFDAFHLVMDTVNPETKKNDAVSAFGVQGIPAKFIIDKQGHIRFTISGFGGSDDDAVAELSTMIELARKNS